MTLSRLTPVLDNQLKADKEFASHTKGMFDPQVEATLDRRLSPPLSALAAPLELYKQLEANVVGRQLSLDRDSSDPPYAPCNPPAPLSDQCAKGWRHASDFLRPQVEELHRRHNLTGARLSSAKHWVKWLPIICFLCTLFGFALGWGMSTLEACGSWHTAQQLDPVTESAGDRGNKITP